jgi:hypothetical protein
VIGWNTKRVKRGTQLISQAIAKPAPPAIQAHCFRSVRADSLAKNSATGASLQRVGTVNMMFRGVAITLAAFYGYALFVQMMFNVTFDMVR